MPLAEIGNSEEELHLILFENNEQCEPLLWNLVGPHGIVDVTAGTVRTCSAPRAYKRGWRERTRETV